jgi:hypothetical protein
VPDESALDERRFMLTGGKAARNQPHDQIRIHRFTAGEDIERGIAILRPRVNGDMTFSDDDDAADALRAEFVKHRIDDRGIRLLCGIE